MVHAQTAWFALTDGFWFILIQGFRFDLILIGMIFGAGFLLKHWIHALTPVRRVGNWVLSVYLGLATSLIFFVEASTLSFIAEYDSRPNYLFVEYLNHPEEVLATLTGTHLWELIVFTAVALLLAWFVARWQRKDSYRNKSVSFLFCLLMTPLIAVMLLMMIRSTLVTQISQNRTTKKLLASMVRWHNSLSSLEIWLEQLNTNLQHRRTHSKVRTRWLLEAGSWTACLTSKERQKYSQMTWDSSQTCWEWGSPKIL